MRNIPDRHRPRVSTIAITPTVTRWPAVARAAGWTLLAMTLTALVVFGPG
jgi:hypothetical protein